MISQRPSQLDEPTRSQYNASSIMRLVNPADQNVVRNVIESLGEDDARMLPDLDMGEALRSGQWKNFPVLVRMKPPESQGEREETDAVAAREKAYAELKKTSLLSSTRTPHATIARTSVAVLRRLEPH